MTSLSDALRTMVSAHRKQSKAHGRAGPAGRLAVEPLEERAVPASTAALVKDLNLGPISSFPSQPVNANGTLFFTADDGITGRELWKSDGTAAGTVLVKDINTGTSYYGGALGSNPSQLTAVGGALFFSANDGVSDTELWKTDGTAEGTVLVKDISTTPMPYGGTSSYPYDLTDFGGVLFFRAFTPEAGNELWKSDGTAEGTVLVKDIYPGSSYSYGYGYRPNNSAPSQLTALGGTLFFTALTAEAGQELWKTDGTAEGTVLVKDVNSTVSPDGFTYTSSPYELTAAGGHLFFTADDGVHGRELWVSDGTEAGTTLTREIRAGTANPFIANLTASGDTLFFTADDGVSGRELWMSDGTAEGTAIAKDTNPGGGSIGPGGLADVNGTVFFGAFEPATGFELWRSDGTAAGTVLVKDINTNTIGASIGHITAVGKTVFFTASAPATGAELFKSDGTAEGTVLVKDINPGAAGSNPSYLTNVNGTLFFVATNPATGKELWKSDGTAAGTELIKDIVPGSNGSYPSELTAVGNTLFFSAGGLWKSDGSTAGTTKVTDSVSAAFRLTNFGGTLLFSGFQPATGVEPWRSDGTVAGTALIKDINPGPDSSFNSGPVVAGGTAFFAAFEPATGVELWRTDGTAAGTVLVKDIRPGTAQSGPENLTAVGGSVYFTAFVPETGRELWRSDGTTAGTTLVKDINTDVFFGNPVGADPRDLTAVGGVLYFRASEPTTGAELWRSDGTEAGTVLVKDINPGSSYGFPLSSDPTELTAVGGKVYFRAAEPAHGAELWESDGTPEGTVLVKDIWPGPRNSFPFGLTAVGRALFFVADDGIHGAELWFAATRAAIDVKPGTTPNLINLNSNGLLPVAVLSTPGFNAANFDPADLARVRFGDADGTARVAPVRYALEDVDGDGDVDLLLFFSMAQIRASGALSATTSSVELSGFLADNTPFVGTDSVQIVGG